MEQSNEPNKEGIKRSEASLDPFKLPIEYLDENVIHTLTDVVASDLELVSATASEPMYDILLKPKHSFAKNMIGQWKKKFTSDTEFLKQTQQIIGKTAASNSTIDCESISTIWKDIYETPGFHDRYSYIDIDKFHFINHSSKFLGVWTVVNLLSPLFSIMTRHLL